MIHAKTIRYTWRDQHPKNGCPSPTFDQELARYLSREYARGYVLQRVEWVIEPPSQRGTRGLVEAVVITRRKMMARKRRISHLQPLPAKLSI